MERKGNRSTIHSQDGPAYMVAYWGFSLHTLSHKTIVDTSLTSGLITSAGGGVDALCRCGRRRRRQKPTDGTSRSGVPAVLSHKAGEVAFVPCSLPRRGQLSPPAAFLKVELRLDIPQVQLPLQLACATALAAHITPCGYFSTSLPHTYLYWLLRTIFVMSLYLIN